MNVDIIIPIYNAFEDLNICLESLYKYTDLDTNRLILINDNSPDERIKPFLDQQHRKNVVVIHNTTNKGFSNNINIGMAQSDTNDVILLNSDTIITANWLEKIQACAYSDKAIGTVTPLSNNATIYSVPKFCEENTLPANMNVDIAASIVEHCSFNEYCTTTVAHGFCMFVKRQVINEIGCFDAKTFERGYGEENDFCNRAQQAGYRHVMCDNTYIYHSGTKSFISKEKEEYIRLHSKILEERYPKQMHANAIYCRDNPNHKISENVDIYFRLHNNKRNILFLAQADFRDEASDNIGGTQLHLHDMVQCLKETYNIYVVARDGQDLAVTAYVNRESMYFRFPMPLTETFPLLSDIQMVTFWKNILNAFHIDLIHIHHIKGSSFDIFDVAKEYHIPIILTLHDFYFVCPTIKLLNEHGCTCMRSTSTDNCRQCLNKQLGYATTIDYITLWRQRCLSYLSMVEKIIVPSNSAKQILSQYYPKIVEKVSVIEHGYTTTDKTSFVISDTDNICSYFEYAKKVGGGYQVIGWAYQPNGDCRKNEIWLRLTVDKESLLIPTTVQYRPDVSPDVKIANCGFIGYIPNHLTSFSKLQAQIVIKTPAGYLLDISKQYEVKIEKEIPQKSLNVAFIGGLNEPKGGKKVAEIVTSNQKDVIWYIFGDIGVAELNSINKENVIRTGHYKSTQLPALLKAHKIDVICLLSLWPETYSYTLTESILNGIPVISTDIGALGERTRQNMWGWTVDVNNITNGVLNILQKLLEDPALLQRKKQEIAHCSIKSNEIMAADYISLYEAYLNNVATEPRAFDSQYIYQGYQYANSNIGSSTIMSSDQITRLQQAYDELRVLKESVTYRLVIRLTQLRIPFKSALKKILTKSK